MTDAHENEHSASPSPDRDAGDELDELLASAVVYEHGTNPPGPEPVFAPAVGWVDDLPATQRRGPEPKVSPLFWAAAVVWSLPGGIGGWLILRKTHPRTARSLLILGIVSFVVLVSAITAAIVGWRILFPSHVTVKG